MKVHRLLITGIFAAVLLPLGNTATLQAQPLEKIPAKYKVTQVTVEPTEIHLQNRFDYRQLLLTGMLSGNEKLDVTRMVEQVQVPECVSVTPTGMVRPRKNGQGELVVRIGDITTKIPVKVTNFDDEVRVSYVRDIMPIMSKMGCNAGTCHGSAKGKNGFQLSLRGYDPVFDHRALTDDLMGRRFDRSAPNRSLMLLKPSGEVPHVGGVLTKPGEPYYEMLLEWIAKGVQIDLDSPRVTRIELFPNAPVIPLPEMKQQMRVIAHYDNGTQRDVSAEAFIESSNTEVAKVDERGLVRALRRGETAMLARYEGKYAAAPTIVMGDRDEFAWKETPEWNHIDHLVYDKLKKVKVLPSDVCTNAEFVRRVYLDLTGLPPTAEKVAEFLADDRPIQVKRNALIDELIGNPDFVDHWTNKWADLLQVNPKFLGGQGAKEFRDWIRKSIQENLPYDQFAYQILTASGSNIQNPAASYWKILRKPDEAMENTTHLFLAVRFNCNKCHDHPFEKWTQDQYFHMAAFFAQVGRKEDPKYKGKKIGGTAVMGATPLVEIIFDAKNGEVTHEKTGKVADPEFPFNVENVPDMSTRREQLAKWITSAENPYFAKSYVNRIWSYLLGRGLIEPVDDIRAGNPPSNPELLNRLTKDFIDSGFNVRELIRAICQSRTYQHSIQVNRWNADDDINYSHAYARRLPAEVLYDAIHRVTGSTARLPGLPAGSRAAELVDPSANVPGGFLTLLGRPPRESACECERSNSMLLGPVLNLVNGPVIANAISDPNNAIHKKLAQEKDNRKVVEFMFLSILNRQPTEKELAIGVEQLSGYEQEHKAMLAHRQKLIDAVTAYEKKLDEQQTVWEKSLGKSATWEPLKVLSTKSNNKESKFQVSPDGTILVSGKPAKNEDYTIELETDLHDITGLRLEVLPDDSLPAKGPGRAENGNFVLNEIRLNVASKNDPKKMQKVQFQRAVADYSQGNFNPQQAINGNARPNQGWAISDKFGVRHVAVFEIKGKAGADGGSKLIVTMQHRYPDGTHVIGKFRLSATTMPQPLNIDLLPANIVKILKVPAEKRNPQQLTAIRNFYRARDNQLPKLREAVNEYPVPEDPRGIGAQDLTWALLNSRSFLFNH